MGTGCTRRHEPHSGVVVQRAELDELDGPVIEAVDAGWALDGRLVGPAQSGLSQEPLAVRRDQGEVVLSGRRVCLRVGLELGPP